MSEPVMSTLFILFFVGFGLREISSKTPYGLFIGSVSILLAVGFIYGSVTRF